MKMKAILIIILFCSSCVILVDKVNFIDVKDTEKIKFNGYYFYSLGMPKYERDSISKDNKTKTIYNNIVPIVFYKNGLAFYKRRGIIEKQEYTDKGPYSSLPHNELNNYWTSINEHSCKTKKDLVGWGNYYIKGDSLIIDYYDYKFQHPGLTSNKLILNRVYGEIIDDSIIQININEYLTYKLYFVENSNIPDYEKFRNEME